MKWITKVELENYRAFPKAKSFSIPFKHHLLMYGENGSGKTSLYKAIRDFFRSSLNTIPQKFELNEFEKSEGNQNGAITIDITDDATGNKVIHNYSYLEPPGESTHRVPDIQLANKVKGFLDYQVILKLHTLHNHGIVNPDFFNFFVHELLGNYRIASPSGGTTTVELSHEYSRIMTQLLNSRRNSRSFNTASDELINLNTELRTVLKSLMNKTNHYLKKYFKNKITIDFGYTDLEVKDKKQPTESMSLRVSYAQQRFMQYNSDLNEARLSALAICLYLASIKINPIPQDAMRILFLDDVFIGLDMSNRMPLLELIRDEFIACDFQLIISTFDRNWFELSRQWFENEKCRFKTMELFVDENEDSSKPDIPVIIDDRSDYLGCGKSYFAAKNYPVAANYLRKECEAALRHILPENLTLVHDLKTCEINRIKNLDLLVNNFFKFLKLNNLDDDPFKYFKSYKKVILNPLSHDDLQASHYGREIKDCITLIENLRQIQTKKIIDLRQRESKPLKLDVEDKNTGVMHKYEINLLENLHIIQQRTTPIKLSVTKCVVEENGNSTKFKTLELAFDHILKERGYPATSDYTDFCENISVNSRKKLKAIMAF
ncbi:AAA family ATPase [bacterium]|nr:AAA family ATPase [bacterium]